MLEISYRLRLEYPLYTILSQYYDYEHINTVHPETLGEYRLVEARDAGQDIIYDHLWPAQRNGKRAVSRVRHRFFPPLTMQFEFIAGRHRGICVRTHLAPEGERATILDEAYLIPGLPNWRWLAASLKPFIMKTVNRIWQEDLQVGVCVDGWPGVPEAARASVKRLEIAPDYPPLPHNAQAVPIPDRRAKGFMYNGRPIAVARRSGKVHAVGGRCPHTGGPLALGRLTADERCIQCPWHGAQFDLATGEVVKGPANRAVESISLA